MYDTQWSQLKDATLRFNQFLPLHYTPSKNRLLECLERRIAIICKRNQKRIDLVLPLELESGDPSAILFQIKNLHRSVDKNYPESATSYLDLSLLPGMNTQTPYLTIYLQIGSLKTEKLRFLQYTGQAIHPGQVAMSASGFSHIVFPFLVQFPTLQVVLSKVLEAWPRVEDLHTDENKRHLACQMMAISINDSAGSEMDASDEKYGEVISSEPTKKRRRKKKESNSSCIRCIALTEQCRCCK